MSISRRDFLKIASAAAAVSAAPVFKSVSAMSNKPSAPPTFSPNYCELCFWNCGLIAKSVNGKVVKIEGNPLSYRGNGKLCGRGNAGLGLLYDPDRLKYPMLNTGKRGDPKWKRVSWNEALSFVADKLNGIKQKYGPEAVALFSHGTGGSFWKHFLNAYGSENSAAPSFAQCRGPRDVGFYLTFGAAPGSPEYYDFARSKFIVLIGSHLGENAHNSQVQDLINGISDGAKLVVLDPRLSNVASKADWWLPVKPATDMAILLAWIKIIIDEELYDKEYISKYAIGLKELKEEVKNYTPEWASKISEIPAATIVEIAHEMAKHKPNLCISGGRFTVWYGDDTQRSRAIAILTALMGSWGREGGYYLPAKGKVPAYPGLPEYPDSESGMTGDYPFALLPVTNAIREAVLTDKPYPCRGWIVYGSNLIKTMPNTKETIEAIKKLDLMVAIDVLPMEITQWADVILPECTYLERFDDIQTGKFQTFEVTLRVPGMKPMFESRPSWWITKELSKKMGLEAYFPWNDIEDYLKTRCDAAGINYEELKQKGAIQFNEKAHPYITAQNQPKFNTPSDKIELYSKQLKEHGFDPVPKYTAHEEPQPGYFRLVFGRSPLHSFSRTVNNFMLNDLIPENELWINTKQALKLGLKKGDYVKLVNQDGIKTDTKIKVKITERLREDCVYMYHGFGANSSGLSRADKRGIGTDQIITKYTIDPLMGGTAIRGIFVKIVKEA
ncbi:MAG: molybdopterin-dependent oxidoreductase [Dissulfurispiraceae bacterium]|jgi:thiosulfate reductase/polysulfide reductase chain A|nr:molybdopterin-dependent oxidoreductase [Dissulfurispiraceae bacterium]